MKAVLCLVVIIALSSAKVAWPVTPCPGGKNQITFAQAFLNAKPSKGSVNEITLIGDVNNHLEFYEVTLTAKLLGVPMQVLHNEYLETYDDGDVVTYIYNNDIPSFTPSGSYLVTFEFQDKVSGLVGCAGIKFTL